MRLLGFALALAVAGILALTLVASASALIGRLLSGAEWLDTPTAFLLMLLALGLAMTLGPLFRGWMTRRREDPPDS